MPFRSNIGLTLTPWFQLEEGLLSGNALLVAVERFYYRWALECSVSCAQALVTFSNSLWNGRALTGRLGLLALFFFKCSLSILGKINKLKPVPEVVSICALLLWDLGLVYLILTGFQSRWPGWTLPVFLGPGGNLGELLILLVPLSHCLRCFLFLSYQNVDGWRLRHSRQQRCPAEPAVLLATSHGGDPQSHRGEWARWGVVSDSQKRLVASGGNSPWLRHAPAAEPVELAIDTLQGGLKSWQIIVLLGF